MEPTYPQGTPEYEAYATELRTELGKFARGEDPYPYRREEMFMPSVPNWIAKAVIVTPNRNGDTVAPTMAWRATKTQVIVRTAPTGSERRFYLDSLTEVGEPKYFRELRTRLESPDAPAAVAARQQKIVDDARRTVLRVVDQQRLQDSRQTPEDVIRKLTAIQDAVSAALGALAEVL